MSFSKFSAFFRSSWWPTLTFALLCFVIAALIILPGSRPISSNMAATIPMSLAIFLGITGLIAKGVEGKPHSLSTVVFGCCGLMLAIGLGISSFVYMPAYDGAVVLPNGDPKEAYSLQRFEMCIAKPWENTIISPLHIQRSMWLPLKTGDGVEFGTNVWFEGDPALLYRTYGKPEWLFTQFQEKCVRELTPLLASANGVRAKRTLRDKCEELAAVDDTLQRLAQELHLTCKAL